MSTELQRALQSVKDAVYAENSRGGQARDVVMNTAKVLGIDLADNPLDRDVWSLRNMRRVTEAAFRLRLNVRDAAGHIARLEEIIRILQHQILELQGASQWRN